MIEVQNSPAVNPSNTIPSQELKIAIERTIFCTSKQYSRYCLNVVRFTSDGKSLALESTDSTRLSRASIEAELPPFSILVGAQQVKSLKKMCRRKADTVSVEVSEAKVVFSSTNGGKVEAPFSDQPKKGFAPVEHIFAEEVQSRIPVLDPGEFRRAVKLALIARYNGERITKTDYVGNLIHVICTSKKTTVFGKSRHNGCRSITHLPSDGRATAVNVLVNGASLLELLSRLPKNQPYELRQWGNGSKGLALVSKDFEHRLAGISKRKEGVQNA